MSLQSFKIIEETACLLNVNAAKIEGSVHEYRLDDVSAIFNLMMDRYLVSKGFWDRDHTIKKEVKRPKTVEIVVMPKTQESGESGQCRATLSSSC